MNIAVLTISDRCSRNQATDTSGPALAAIAREKLSAQITATALVPDDIEKIAAQITAWSDAPNAPDIIVTTGGTGLSPRDVTPEATRPLLHRPHPALLELARLRTSQLGASPKPYLSRGEAGVRHRTLILNLPGSQRGATEMLTALLDLLPHALAMLQGADHPRP